MTVTLTYVADPPWLVLRGGPSAGASLSYPSLDLSQSRDNPHSLVPLQTLLSVDLFHTVVRVNKIF